MKIKLVCIGKLKSKAAGELVGAYAAKTMHYFPFETIVIPDVKGGGGADAGRQKSLEAEKILQETAATDMVILFDEKGREYTSRAFAEYLDRLNLNSVKRLVLVIGGPYGFDKTVYDRADGLMSLSKMTLPHELARVMAMEQLYRAGTILRGEPYHHD